MEIIKNIRGSSIGLLSIVLLVFVFSQSVFAAGTTQNQTISNSATVDYNVNTIAQTQLNSNTYQFVVDRKVTFTVVKDEVAVVSVTPGSNDNVLTFTVTNNGNDTFDYTVAAEQLVGGTAEFGGTDNINATTVDVFVESGATVGYQAAQDTATSIDDLAADANIKVYLVSDFALGLSDDAIAGQWLLVTALTSAGGALSDDSGSADTVGTVQNVFDAMDGPATGDAANDAKFSDGADYQVVTASLTITKASTVISDPISGTTNPKAIPGAVIEYSITIDNGAGAGTATDIDIADSLNTEIATNGYLAFNTTYNVTAGQGISISSPDCNAGAYTEYTNTNADSNECGTVEADFTTNVVNVTGIQLDASESAIIKFRVTVQ